MKINFISCNHHKDKNPRNLINLQQNYNDDEDTDQFEEEEDEEDEDADMDDDKYYIGKMSHNKKN